MRRLAVALALAGAALAGCEAFPLDAVSIDPGSLSRDLVAHWAFDQTSGPAVIDGAGDHHDGALTGGAWIEDGRFGSALRLAAGDHVAVAGFPQAASSWTVSVWTRASAADLALAARTSELVPILSAETLFSGGWQINLDNRAGEQRFLAAYWVGGTLNDYVRAYCSCVEPDRWIHLTAVWDEQRATESLYLDDQQVGHARMPSPIAPGDTTLYMGTWTQLNRFFAGDIDDVAIWRRALQPIEIATLSGKPAGP